MIVGETKLLEYQTGFEQFLEVVKTKILICLNAFLFFMLLCIFRFFFQNDFYDRSETDDLRFIYDFHFYKMKFYFYITEVEAAEVALLLEGVFISYVRYLF